MADIIYTLEGGTYFNITNKITILPSNPNRKFVGVS